jgi:hypothetical protein
MLALDIPLGQAVLDDATRSFLVFARAREPRRRWTLERGGREQADRTNRPEPGPRNIEAPKLGSTCIGVLTPFTLPAPIRRAIAHRRSHTWSWPLETSRSQGMSVPAQLPLGTG